MSVSAWLWLAALALLLAGLLALALASPVRVHAFAVYPAQPPVRVDVRWLYGLVDLEGLGPSGQDEQEVQPEPGDTGPVEAADEKTEEPEQTPDEEARDPLDRVEGVLDTGVTYLETRRDAREIANVALAVLRTEDFLLELTRFLRDLVGAVEVDRIGIKAGFGFGSPAETGKVYGQLQAAFAWTRASQRISVDLQPDFHELGFEGGADVALEARTWDLLRGVIVFALAEPTWEAIGNAREAHHG